MAAFNAEMYDEDTDGWKNSLEVLLTLDVPCIFTSYNKYAGDEDYAILTEVGAKKLTEAPVLNPFRVDFPFVDDGFIDRFFYANMYCTCFKGRADTGD